MTTYNEIFKKNREWITRMKATDAQFFEKLSEGQNPELLYIVLLDLS